MCRTSARPANTWPSGGFVPVPVIRILAAPKSASMRSIFIVCVAASTVAWAATDLT
jgi:hypothetical protein